MFITHVRILRNGSYPNEIICVSNKSLITSFFSYQRTLGFAHRIHLRLTLFMRIDVSSVSQKLITTSLVVTCDSVNSLLGNHMKSFNIVIFSKLIFSVFVLM